MKKLLIDGKKIDSRETLFTVLREQLQSENFQGNNLDALYDVLTEYAQPVKIEVENPAALEENLGEYASRFIRVLRDAEKQQVTKSTDE